MDNPWLELSANPPFVLESDIKSIESLNARSNVHQQVQMELLPEPYIGRLDAPIVILLLNPGYSPWDERLYETPEAKELWRRNIHQEFLEYPFYMIDPAYIASIPSEVPRIKPRVGPFWWKNTLNQLARVTSDHVVANEVCCIEYFPYHTVRKPQRGELLPSQHYTFFLVKQAIARGAVILLGRNQEWWFEAVPALANYQNLFKAVNKRQSVIGRGNYPQAFDVVSNILRNHDLACGHHAGPE